MSDQSSVTIAVELPGTYTEAEVNSWIELVKDVYEQPFSDIYISENAFGASGRTDVQLEDYEVPWGIHNDEVEAALKFIQGCGFPYRAYDGGHYTWDPSVQVWQPGMDKPVWRPCGIEGELYLTADAVTNIIANVSDPSETVDYIRDCLSLDHIDKWPLMQRQEGESNG